MIDWNSVLSRQRLRSLSSDAGQIRLRRRDGNAANGKIARFSCCARQGAQPKFDIVAIASELASLHTGGRDAPRLL